MTLKKGGNPDFNVYVAAETGLLKVNLTNRTCKL